VLAEEDLPEPERESLLADAARSLKEQTCRQRSTRCGSPQLALQRCMAKERNEPAGSIRRGRAWWHDSLERKILPEPGLGRIPFPEPRAMLRSPLVSIVLLATVLSDAGAQR